MYRSNFFYNDLYNEMNNYLYNEMIINMFVIIKMNIIL